MPSKRVVVERLKVYLYGPDFVVKADNNSLTYGLTLSKLDTTDAVDGCSVWTLIQPEAPESKTGIPMLFPEGPYGSDSWIQLEKECKHYDRGWSTAPKTQQKLSSKVFKVTTTGISKYYGDLFHKRGKGFPRLSKKDL